MCVLSCLKYKYTITATGVKLLYILFKFVSSHNVLLCVYIRRKRWRQENYTKSTELRSHQ